MHSAAKKGFDFKGSTEHLTLTAIPPDATSLRCHLTEEMRPLILVSSLLQAPRKTLPHFAAAATQVRAQPLPCRSRKFQELKKNPGVGPQLLIQTSRAQPEPQQEAAKPRSHQAKPSSTTRSPTRETYSLSSFLTETAMSLILFTACQNTSQQLD